MTKIFLFMATGSKAAKWISEVFRALAEVLFLHKPKSVF